MSDVENGLTRATYVASRDYVKNFPIKSGREKKKSKRIESEQGDA